MKRRLLRALATLRRLDPATVQAAWWAARSLRSVRRELPAEGLAVRVPPPPRLPPHAIRGVTGLAVLARATCLERSLIIQRWLVEHGSDPELLVGVANLHGEGFRAHAWVPEFDAEPEEYEVITRVRALPSAGGCP